MAIQTIQRYIHTSPRKLRLVADMVRNMEPDKALETLRFTNKAASKPLQDAIVSVLASARQKGMEKVAFASLEINEGPKMRRFRAGTRGRVKPYKRRMAHIKIVLSDSVESSEEIKSSSKKSKVEAKKGEKIDGTKDTSGRT